MSRPARSTIDAAKPRATRSVRSAQDVVAMSRYARSTIDAAKPRATRSSRSAYVNAGLRGASDRWEDARAATRCRASRADDYAAPPATAGTPESRTLRVARGFAASASIRGSPLPAVALQTVKNATRIARGVRVGTPASCGRALRVRSREFSRPSRACRATPGACRPCAASRPRLGTFSRRPFATR